MKAQKVDAVWEVQGTQITGCKNKEKRDFFFFHFRVLLKCWKNVPGHFKTSVFEMLLAWWTVKKIMG